MLSASSSFKGRRGASICCLIADNQASKLAWRMARSILRPHDELQLLTVVLNDDSIAYGNNLLAPYAGEPGSSNTVSPIVLVKGDARMADVIKSFAAAAGTDLLVVGSHSLCSSGSRDDPLPASGSFAMRLVRLVRCCPVLVVKANTKGPFLRSTNWSMGLKVMVACQGNSRHMLEWLTNQLDAHKDALFLAVTKATQDKQGGSSRVKTTAMRMLTNFGVQASSNGFYTAQRVYRQAGSKELPQAVEVDAIDILAVQAPDCKLLPDSLIELLGTARSSLLVYHQKQQPQQQQQQDLLEAPSAQVAAN